jgi:hypothetical protein
VPLASAKELGSDVRRVIQEEHIVEGGKKSGVVVFDHLIPWMIQNLAVGFVKNKNQSVEQNR